MEFEVIITQDFLVYSHFQRMFYHWLKYVLIFCVIIAWIITDIMSGGPGSVSISGATLIVICILYYSVKWNRRLNFIREWIKEQGDKPVKYIMTETAIEEISCLRTTTLNWKVFKKLKIFDLDTLLEYRLTGCIALPTDQLSDEIVEYLVRRFKSHRKDVINRKKQTKKP